jgi:hypothetical protein
VDLSGTAADEASLLGYARTLKEGGRFSTVVVSNISRGDGSVSFTMILN